MTLVAEGQLSVPSPRQNMGERVRAVVAQNLFITPNTVATAAASRRLLVAQKIDPETGLPLEVRKPVPWMPNINGDLFYRYAQKRIQEADGSARRFETIRVAPVIGTVALVGSREDYFELQPIVEEGSQEPRRTVIVPFSTNTPAADAWQFQWGARPETGEAFAAPTA